MNCRRGAESVGGAHPVRPEACGEVVPWGSLANPTNFTSDVLQATSTAGPHAFSEVLAELGMPQGHSPTTSISISIVSMPAP